MTLRPIYGNICQEQMSKRNMNRSHKAESRFVAQGEVKSWTYLHTL